MHTGTTTNVVESELGDSRVELQEEGQRLADATSSTEYGDLGELSWPTSGLEVSNWADLKQGGS